MEFEVKVESNQFQEMEEKTSKNVSWLLYGAYGYVGELIIRRAIEMKNNGKQGPPIPILAGRNSYKMNRLIERLKPLLPSSVQLHNRIFSLEDKKEIDKGLEGITVVLLAAGPYKYTCKEMVESCIRTKTNYMDISEEIDTLEYVMSKEREASSAGIVLIPGVAFEILATDCLLSLISQKVSGVTHAEIAVFCSDWLSRGAWKSILEKFSVGEQVREDGKIIIKPFAWKEKDIEFSTGVQHIVSFPLGDISTAFYSTGAKNVTTYRALSRHTASWMKGHSLNLFTHLTSWYYFKATLQAILDWTLYGPSEEELNKGSSEIWARVYNDVTEEECIGTVSLPEKYKFTANSVVISVGEFLLTPHSVPLQGSLTPSSAFGNDILTKIDQVMIHPLKYNKPKNSIYPFKRKEEE